MSAMRPRFGDFLALASEHLEAATADGAKLPTAGAHGAVCELSRVTAAMARSADAFVRHDPSDETRSLDAPAQALLDARGALRRAAASMRTAAVALGNDGADWDHPAVKHLSAAADCFIAGHDLLQTHFAPGPWGSRRGNSLWAPVVMSAPAHAALVAEMGRYAGRVALWVLWLPSARAPGDGLPTRAHVAVTAACRWLRVAEAAAWAAECYQEDIATGRALLRAVPANVVPPRYLPSGGESVPVLCAGTAATAERLRHLAHFAASRPANPKTATATSLQRTAQGAAIAGHCSELILRTLTEPAAQIAVSPAAAAALKQATEAICQAWTGWRTAAHAWDTLTTPPGTQLTPVAIEIGDLVLWAGRLTHSDPTWIPARHRAGPLRDAADLAARPDRIANVLTALGEITDVLARIAAHDRESVRAAAVKNAICLPTRLLPDGCDQPYRYVPAGSEMVDALLATYDATIQATEQAVTALSDLARVLNFQPTALVPFGAIAQPDMTELPPPLVASGNWPALRPAPGTVEEVLRSRGISEPALLARAAEIDEATRNLISAATATSRRQAAIARRAQPAPEGSQDLRIHPAGLAAKDAPHATTGSRTPLPRLVPINHRIRHGITARRKPTP